jgi:NADH-quinone oxidoreductase E subunit
VYVPTDANSQYQSFEFTEENWAKCVEILAKYPPQYKNSGLAPILDIAQRQCGGWLPLAAMNKVATVVEVAPMDVYEVASFYTMFNLAPIGKHFVQLCGTTPCHAMRAPEIMAALKQRLGVENGGTTADGKFTLLEVECLGACVNAPMMQIDDDYYEDLTPETAIKVIDELAAGRKPQFGPQNGKRKYAEPYGGKTTLKGTPTGPYAPYLEKLDAEAASSSAPKA